MMNFDSPNRETCTVRETRTNTPLQALNLMNDVTFLEASRKLAERMMTGRRRDARERIDYALPSGAGSPAASRRRSAIVLRNAWRIRDALSKRSQVGDGAPDARRFAAGSKLDPRELAAYTAIASLILNLDETITKE